MDLNRDEVEYILTLIDNEVKSNENFLDDIKDREEREFWISTNDDLLELRKKFIESEIVLQQLDEMIEARVDDLTELKHEVINYGK